VKYIIFIFIVAVIIVILAAIGMKIGNAPKQTIAAYRKKYLLTKNEYSFYQKIKPIIQEKNLRVLCKIRLADLIEPEPNKNQKEWYAAFNRIKSKHIDFAIATENMKVIVLVELQDNTHQKSDRKERDEFVNTAVTRAGYILLSVYNNADGLKQLEDFLKSNQ
jgi:topoisomerase-associated Zn-finger domain protein